MYFKIQKIISEVLGQEIEPNSVTFDSRSATTGSLFFAIKGAKSDGRLFAQHVLDLGGYVVTDLNQAPQEFVALKSDKIIIVENVEESIIKIASKIRDLIPLVIGITGSSGKTFTKNALGKVLQDYGQEVLVPESNYNTEYGLLLTLCRLKSETKYAILELGVGKPGDMDILGRIARPDRMVILPIEMAHLEVFHDQEDLIAEKLKVLEYMNEDALVVAHDSLKNYLNRSKIIFYSNIKIMFDKEVIHLKGKILLDDKILLIENRSLYGNHLLENMLAILFVLYDLVPRESIIISLNLIQPMEGRNYIYDLTLDQMKYKLYDSSYNANAGRNGSMMRELEAVSKFPADLILVLGGMLSIGSGSQVCHREVLDYAKTLTNKIITIGTEWPEAEGIIANLIGTEVEKIAELIFASLTESCIVFLKGSNKYSLSLVSGHLRRSSYAF